MTGQEIAEGLPATEADFERASAEVARLQCELDITNADHIALWLEANMDDKYSLGSVACRIVEAHEEVLKAIKKALLPFATPPLYVFDSERLYVPIPQPEDWIGGGQFSTEDFRQVRALLAQSQEDCNASHGERRG